MTDIPEAVAQTQSEIDRDEDEAYELGRRDGWSEAVQHIDCLTSGDGEYYANTMPGRGCETPAQMIDGIVERFATRPEAIPAEAVRALVEALGGPLLIEETVNYGLWSATFHFGRGDEAMHRMRAVADASRILQAQENTNAT